MKSISKIIVIYSASQVMSCALDTLCRVGNKDDMSIICVHEADELKYDIGSWEAQCVILDIVAHRNAYWLYTLRLRFPSVPIIVTQRRILFSDRVLAEYLGMIWLREYDSILAAWPVFSLIDVIGHKIFSGPGAGVTQTKDKLVMSPEFFCHTINKWLRKRLGELFIEYPSAIVVIDGLLKKIPVKTLGEKMSVSSQSIYLHRKKIMNKLHIQHYEREFFRSLQIQILDNQVI